VQQQLRGSTGTLARLETFAAYAERLDNLLGDTNNGLGPSLQAFTDAINEVSTTPSSIAARQVLLAEGNALVDRLRTSDARLRDLSEGVDSRLTSEVGEVNTLTRAIARLNGDIALAVQNTGQAPNDLVDQRDLLIDQLSAKVSVAVVAEGESTLNVFVGNGLPLVLGNTSSELTTITDTLDPERLQPALRGPAGTIDISRSISGGVVGGLLDWRREMLDPARNELGRIALAVTQQVNAQHREGMDLTGALGGNFFNVGSVGVNPATTNAGSGVVTVTRTDLSALTDGNYTLTRTSSGYALRRADTGANVTFSGTGTTGDPIIADGLSIVVGPGAAVGDQFLIRPTRDAILGFGVAITDPARIAAAAPIRANPATGNLGSATITPGEVLDSGNASLLNTVNIVFTSATTFTVNGGPAQAYSSGSNIDINGWRVAISGTPASGDSFTVRSNAGAVGDNRNAFALADSIRAGVIEGGTVSVATAIERMTGELGLATRAAQLNRDAEAVVHESDIAARDSVSGVNLDEEAANMLRYQQAYAASAQVISVANSLFETLMNAVRR
jgi:flagellar hook-associated protein 1